MDDEHWAALRPHVRRRDHEAVVLGHGVRFRGWGWAVAAALIGVAQGGGLVALVLPAVLLGLAAVRRAITITVTPRSVTVRPWRTTVRFAEIARVHATSLGVLFERRGADPHRIALPDWSLEAREALVALVRAQIDLAHREGTAAEVPSALKGLRRREPER